MENKQLVKETCEEIIPGCNNSELHGHVPDILKESLLKRMNRIVGQVRGVKGMIERDVYCDDILNQMSAVQSALQAVSRLLLESHLKTCVVERLKKEEYEVIEEFMKTVTKLVK
ncbi:metal-sensitive transcriptional regulator [Sutcliffiella cohnii]|uniref:metal-sensitive transcriptional regulator n=1 Tax=Sutcliffiella cohnii TaxID=33932 RepID=UPI002E1B8247|nr:metal-sensitive transcriptional regulator [Sutcliffiella cohnii]